jgi:hypothetical protein
MKRLVLTLSLLTVTTAANAQNLYNSWSTTSADFGVWELGTKSTATAAGLTLLNEYAVNYPIAPMDSWKNSGPAWPFVARNSTGTTHQDVGSTIYNPFSTTFHPGETGVITARYVAPITSSYDVAATFVAAHTLPWGDNKRITIANASGVLDTFVLGALGGSHTSSLTSINLQQGDWLDFSLEGIDTGNTPSYWGTSTKFDLTVKAVPEPATLSVLGLGLLAFARKRRTNA